MSPRPPSDSLVDLEDRDPCDACNLHTNILCGCAGSDKRAKGSSDVETPDLAARGRRTPPALRT